MPRRISDYPDAFAGWNLISSFGSIISVVATWLFLHLVYLQLVEGKAATRYPWLTPQFYSDTLQTLLNRSYNSLEWALNSPPKPHAFVSLPLQSKVGFSSFNKHLILTNIVTAMFIFILFFWLRNCVFTQAYFIGTLSVLENYSWNFSVNRDFFLGILAVISRLSLKGFVEEFLELFSVPRLTIGGPITTLSMNMDNSGAEGSDPKKPYRIIPENKIDAEYADFLLIKHLKTEFKLFQEDMDKLAEGLNKRRMHYKDDKFTLDSSGMSNILVMMLQDQTTFLNVSIRRRVAWLNILKPNLPLASKEEFSKIAKEVSLLHEDFTNNISNIGKIKDEKQQVKEYFNLVNGYRNKVRKELVRLEGVTHEGLRNMPNLYKEKEFKQLINVDVPKVIKKVVDEDSYLKQKISEIINAKKK